MERVAEGSRLLWAVELDAEVSFLASSAPGLGALASLASCLGVGFAMLPVLLPFICNISLMEVVKAKYVPDKLRHVH